MEEIVSQAELKVRGTVFPVIPSSNNMDHAKVSMRTLILGSSVLGL